MKQRPHSKPGRWAKIGLSATIVPTLMLGLVAFERADTGTPTLSASESLELVKHRNRNNSGGGASALAKPGSDKAIRRCQRAVEALERQIDRLEDRLARGGLSNKQRARIQDLIARLQARIAQFADCRPPSGTP